MGRTTKTKDKVKLHKTIESRTDFFYYTFRNILLFSIPLLIISGLVLSRSFSYVSADNPNNGSGSSTDNLSISIDSACTLSSTINTSHSASVNVGTYVDNIGKTTVNTLCNDGNGYAIYANGYSNDIEGNNNLVNTVNSNLSIPSGLATSGLDSNWAMSLNHVVDDTSPTPPTIEDDYDGIYGIVPSTWTKVASLPSSATDMNQGSSFTTTYAVYTSSSQTTGTYEGKVKYMLVHPSYKPAVYFMQDVAEWKNTIGMEESVQAVDKRDGKVYWVTKLKDGNIWMTQNLDLCIGCEGVAALTSENTDISTDPNITGKGIYASTSTGGYSESGGVWTWTPASTAITSSSIVNYGNNTVSNWTHGNTTPASAEAGDTYFYTSGNNNNDKRYDSLELCKKDHTEADCMHYHAGNYYNYTAAIASNASSGISANTAIAGNSICPRGWRLPYASTTDNSYNEFGRLFYNSAYNITNNIAGSGNVGYKTGGFNTLRTSPLWFVRSGNIDNGALNYPAANGGYWSSTVASSTVAYGLLFRSSNIYPANSDNRSVGWSIRCLAR